MRRQKKAGCAVGFYESFSSFVGDVSVGAPGAEVDSLVEDTYTLDNLALLFVDNEAGVTQVFDQIEAEADTDPFLALTHATALVGIINHAQTKSAKLSRRLASAINRLHAILEKIKVRTKAATFTITVGFPFNISIGVTF
jgi:hypothetical protein